MINNVYWYQLIKKIMPYNQITVVLGGLMHIPVIILVIRFIENRFNNRNWTREELNYNKIAWYFIITKKFINRLYKYNK